MHKKFALAVSFEQASEDLVDDLDENEKAGYSACNSRNNQLTIFFPLMLRCF